jgi:hypothetical protein
MASALPTLLTNKSKGGGSARLTEEQDKRLMDTSVHTQHKDYAKMLDTISIHDQHVKTMKKKGPCSCRGDSEGACVQKGGKA